MNIDQLLSFSAIIIFYVLIVLENYATLEKTWGAWEYQLDKAII